MREVIAAHTTAEPSYPGFVNFTRQEDGSVLVTVRGDPTAVDGIYICGFPGKDDNDPDRCVPGNDRCNNYCNMAPEKGPMADSAIRHHFNRCGETVSTVLTAQAFAELREKLSA